MIKILDIYKSFNKKGVLKGLNLEITNKETLVILGKSGCGKSVLLKHILGLLKPDSGKILIDGNDITSISYRQLQKIRMNIGMLFQSSALFDSMTVEQNVGLGLRRYSELPEKDINKRISDCLALVGLKGVMDLFPSELSGGMKKRAGLARAIAMNPKYILYDEPTTGLDPATANVINDNIIRLKEQLNVTSVVVTHDINCVKRVSDRIAMLHDGKIIFTGTFTELKESDEENVRQFLADQDTFI